MSKTEVAIVKERSLAKGLIAGIIGGLAGMVAKTFAERVFPPGTPEDSSAQESASEPANGQATASQTAAIHWGLGAAVGAAYGALAEFYPAATSKEGASFGIALETLTREGALPAIGASAEPEDETFQERASEVTSYVVFGITTETIRGFVRKRL